VEESADLKWGVGRIEEFLDTVEDSSKAKLAPQGQQVMPLRRESLCRQVADADRFYHCLDGFRLQVVGNAHFPQNGPRPDALFSGNAFIAMQDNRHSGFGENSGYGRGQLRALHLAVVRHSQIEQPLDSGTNLRSCFCPQKRSKAPNLVDSLSFDALRNQKGAGLPLGSGLFDDLAQGFY